MFDESLGDEIRVTVIATGIGQEEEEEAHYPPELVSLKSGLAQEADIEGSGVRHEGVKVYTTRDEPSIIRIDDINGGVVSRKRAQEGTPFKGLDELDEDELEVPTFLRRKAD